ncbi:TLE3 protein [Vespula maculifrons]|uniref:TLE3 protein n=1 Tax=Vespula maculifrons TaxID=7453 RepID=A0ABD2B0I7_VESMC
MYDGTKNLGSSFVFQGPPQPGQPFKFSVSESCDRIKEEFSFLQAQYHSIKLDLEKLAQEKTEMQRHYVMVSTFSFLLFSLYLHYYYEMSYGLNVEMHKQVSIKKIRTNIFSKVSITLLVAMHEHA